MRTSSAGIGLIKLFEGFKSKPYKCPAGIWTIGYGATYHIDGRKISPTDKPITQAEGVEMLKQMLIPYEKGVDSFTRDDISQGQFDALVSFAYNVGLNALRNSTLIKKVNKNPSDPSIAKEFLKWNKVNGKALQGLTRRREAEAKLYFS